jgi:hypothetical protein
VRTLAAARYLLARLALGQAALVPVVAFGAVLAVLFGGDPGPPPAPWAASALAAYPVAAWLAVLVAHVEDPAERSATLADAAGVARVTAGTLLVALAADVLLAVLAVAWPVVVTAYRYPPAMLLTALLAHLATAATGTAVGLLCARPLIRRTGATFVVAGVVLVVTGVQRSLPPVGTTVGALAAGSPAPPAGGAVLGIGLALAASAVVIGSDRLGR